jgi:hypothetical protein
MFSIAAHSLTTSSSCLSRPLKKAPAAFRPGARFVCAGKGGRRGYAFSRPSPANLARPPLALDRRHGARAERRLARPATGERAKMRRISSASASSIQLERPPHYPGRGTLLFQTLWPSVPISAWWFHSWKSSDWAGPAPKFRHHFAAIDDGRRTVVQLQAPDFPGVITKIGLIAP